MKDALSRRRPSASMMVALAALFVALGGSAVAAQLASSGDLLIKKQSLSGNRLRNHTVTGTQVNLAKLGKVPSAKTADTAASASNATNAANANHAGTADNATNATHATNADTAATATKVATLQSGHSESGMFGAGGGSPASYIGEGITYAQPLATAIPDGNIVDVKGSSATHCPGIGQADQGYLCLYERIYNQVGTGYGYSSSQGFTSPSVGVVLYWPITGANAYSGGEYTVTAP